MKAFGAGLLAELFSIITSRTGIKAIEAYAVGPLTWISEGHGWCDREPEKMQKSGSQYVIVSAAALMLKTGGQECFQGAPTAHSHGGRWESSAVNYSDVKLRKAQGLIHSICSLVYIKI